MCTTCIPYVCGSFFFCIVCGGSNIAVVVVVVQLVVTVVCVCQYFSPQSATVANSRLKADH